MARKIIVLNIPITVPITKPYLNGCFSRPLILSMKRNHCSKQRNSNMKTQDIQVFKLSFSQ